MRVYTTSVGLDAHKESIEVTLLRPGKREAVAWRCRNNAAAVRQMVKKVRKLASDPERVLMCYEAGPCGYALQREIERHGVSCVVVAPSLIPTKPGERVKTDRRDARKLAELLRAGLLTEVVPPSAAEEAVRDLCRCRGQAKKDLMAARHRLTKYLLRRGIVYTAGRHWTDGHRRWLKGLRFEHQEAQVVFDTYLMVVGQAEERVKMLVGEMEKAAEKDLYREPVRILRGFRGIDTVTALTVVAELHGITRFRHPRELMSYLGLVPSEYSSGGRERRGEITKAGNGHVRRMLVEAAWNYRHRPVVSAALRKRREGLPAWAVKLSDTAMQRLHRRYGHLVWRGKQVNKAVVGTARELSGFIWAALQELEARKGLPNVAGAGACKTVGCLARARVA
jgi:transposase